MEWSILATPREWEVSRNFAQKNHKVWLLISACKSFALHELSELSFNYICSQAVPYGTKASLSANLEDPFFFPFVWVTVRMRTSLWELAKTIKGVHSKTMPFVMLMCLLRIKPQLQTVTEILLWWLGEGQIRTWLCSLSLRLFLKGEGVFLQESFQFYCNTMWSKSLEGRSFLLSSLGELDKESENESDLIAWVLPILSQCEHYGPFKKKSFNFWV